MTVGKIENGLERGFIKHRLNCLLITHPVGFFKRLSSPNFSGTQPKSLREVVYFKQVRYSALFVTATLLHHFDRTFSLKVDLFRSLSWKNIGRL